MLQLKLRLKDPMGSKTPIDIAAGALAFGSVVEVLPAVASIATIVWMGLRIYQTVVEIRNKKRKDSE